MLHMAYEHFTDQSHDFEQHAVGLWQTSQPNVASIDVTRPWRDGGRDAAGDYLLGPRDDRSRSSSRLRRNRSRVPSGHKFRHAEAVDSGTWWKEFLEEPAAAGKRTDQAVRLKQLLAEALAGPVGKDQEADLQLRRRAAYQLTQMANRVWLSHESAGAKRSKAHTAQRLAAGGSAAAAAGTGGALAAGLGGSVAAVLGIVVIGIGILAGISAAIIPESEYERNRGKARQYEKLWWDIWNFTTLELPSIETGAIYAKLEEFNTAIRAVGED